ncbi:uncharacterized protein LOC108900371 isoform X2 [Lates japonicus]
MLKWWDGALRSKHLVDKIIHSIFFLGKINNPPYTPKSIVGVKMLTELERDFPLPFRYYSSKLPKRGPFSCVMDMMVLLKGQENEDQIKQSLRDLINNKLSEKKNKKFLVSTTICVSQKSNNSVRYYGVSMSATGYHPRRILVAAACCSAWDDYVSDAVMTYYPNTVKKSYFDGTIKLPEGVRCDAFNLSNGDDKNPCMLCRDLFGLQVKEGKKQGVKESEVLWPYGNCAEAESLSNLLKKEKEVKENTQQKLHNPEDRQTAKDSVLAELIRLLDKVKFDTWDNDFYTPQIEQS